MNKDLFEKWPVPKAVFTLALPGVLGMIVTIIYNMADTFFVGQTGDMNQVAAVSLATPVFMLFMAVGNIFGMGGSSVISRKMGEQNLKAVQTVSSFCIYMSVACGLLLSICLIIFMNPLLSLIGTSDQTREFARQYLTYIAIGGTFVTTSFTLSNLVRGEGAARVSMTGQMIGTFTNIILDPIMILFLGMGVSGAAIATVIGNVFAVLFYVYYLTKKKTILSINPKMFSTTDIWKPVFAIGLPAALNNVLMSTATIILNNFLASYGDVPVAAMGVAQKANMLVVLVQIGMASGIQPLIGYCYGCKNLVRMKKIMKFTMLCNFIFGTSITLLYFIFSKQIISAFINDAAVIENGIQILRALMISGPILGIMFVLSFGFQAMGAAVSSMILSLSRQGLFFLPILFISSRVLGLNGIVYAQPAADILSVIVAIILFLALHKKLENQVEDRKEVV